MHLEQLLQQKQWDADVVFLLPVDLPMSRVKFNVNSEYAYLQNFKILQSECFTRLAVLPSSTIQSYGFLEDLLETNSVRQTPSLITRLKD